MSRRPLNWRHLTLCCALLLVSCRATVHPSRWWDETPSGSTQHRFKATSAPVISSPVAWDLNNDGIMEIAIGSWDGYFYVVDVMLDDLAGWPKHSHKGFFSSPALADLDNDGAMEILVGAESGHLFAWHSDGTPVSNFPVDLGYHIWAGPTILPGPRIAIGGFEQMFLLDAQGKHVPGWPQDMPGWADATVASDGKRLAVTSLTPGDPSQGWITAWTLDGERLPGFPIALKLDSDSSPALAILDHDALSLIFGDDAGRLYVYDLQGRPRPGFPVQTEGPAPGPTPTPHPPGGNIYSIEASPAVADMDGDGRMEIAVGSWDGQMYLWDADGRPLTGWPIRVQDQIISSAALVDLNGDDQLDIVVGSKDGNLYGWTMRGSPLPGFPYALGSSVFSSPWIGDLEGDGRADVVVGANNGIHLLRDIGPLGRRGWPMFHANEANTGWQEQE